MADADELNDADADDDFRRVTQLRRAFDRSRQPQQLHRRIHGEEQHRDAAEDAPGPDRSARRSESRRARSNAC